MDSCGTDLLCSLLSQFVEEFTLGELNSFKVLVLLTFAGGFYYAGSRLRQAAVYKEAFINGIQFNLAAEANKKAGINGSDLVHMEPYVAEAKSRNARLGGLVHANVFGNVLNQAAHLLHKGYKDEAARIIGVVLEQHIKQLCKRHDIPTEKDKGGYMKTDTLNAQLANKEIYSKLDQKSITAWAGLRNHAAHGQHNEYSAEQVTLMLEGVRDFILRIPA